MATRKKRASKRSGPAKKNRARNPARKRAAARKSPSPKRSPRKAAKTSSKPRKPGRRAAAKPPLASSVPKAAPPKRSASPLRKTSARRAGASAFDTSLLPCGDAALLAATGKGWDAWFAALDAAGAAKGKFDHQRVLDLALQFVPASAGWWAQMASVGYERVRGLREKHESCTGDFQSTLSKTLPVPLFAAFAAWADESLRSHWLDAPGLDFTKLNVGKNIRARWPDGARLDIRFNATGPDRCQIVVDTMKLADAEAVMKAKAFWQSQFERLQAYLRV